jgi:hypothetical protein
VNGDSKTGGVPLSLRVNDPVEWLATADRDVELHATIRHLLDDFRLPEAVMCLEWHIGRTAPVRAQVEGWDGPWVDAVADLARNRSVRECRSILRLLKTTKSTRKATQ